MRRHPGYWFLIFLVSGGATAWGGGLEQVALVVTDPAERKAVLRVAGGSLQVLAPGELIEGTGATVERVLADRVAVSEITGEPRRRKRGAWIYARDRGPGVLHVRYFEWRADAVGAAASPAWPPQDTSSPDRAGEAIRRLEAPVLPRAGGQGAREASPEGDGSGEP